MTIRFGCVLRGCFKAYVCMYLCSIDFIPPYFFEAGFGFVRNTNQGVHQPNLPPQPIWRLWRLKGLAHFITSERTSGSFITLTCDEGRRRTSGSAYAWYRPPAFSQSTYKPCALAQPILREQMGRAEWRKPYGRSPSIFFLYLCMVGYLHCYYGASHEKHKF